MLSTPALQLGVPDDVLDSSKKLGLFEDLEAKKKARESPWRTAASLCTVTDGLSTVSFLRGEWKQVQHWGMEAVNAADYYLFGDWRERDVTDEGRINPDWWFSHGVSWTLPLSMGLCWSSLLNMWTQVGKFLTFPTDGIAMDSEGALARLFYIGLAKWWRDHGSRDWMEDVKRIGGARSKGFHLRADMLDAVARGQGHGAQDLMVKYMEFWLKRVKKWPQELAKEGTVHYHLCERAGITLDLPEELSMHLLIMPDEDQQ